jgi:hypothetical protein
MFGKSEKSALEKKDPMEVKELRSCPSGCCIRINPSPPKFLRLKRFAHRVGLFEPHMESAEVVEFSYSNHIDCHYCRELHAVADLDIYASPKRRNKFFSDSCWKINEKIRTATFIHPEFSFTVMRMIMKLHRLGRDCTVLLGALKYDSGPIMEGAHAKQLTVKPKIVGGRLFMRSYTAYVVPSYEPSMIFLLNRNFLKCPHTKRWSYNRSHNNRLVTERLFQRFAAPETINTAGPEDIMSCQCHFCATEFQIGVQRFEGQGVLVLVTEWQDLGTGVSGRPEDLPTVVGPRRMLRHMRGDEKPLYDSPRAR